MYIDVVRNRNSPPAILLRESYRSEGRVCKRTLANLTALPADAIAALRNSLKGRRQAGELASELPGGFEITTSLPFGHVAAVTGVMRQLGMGPLIDRVPGPLRQRVLAMIAARVLAADSKLATAAELAEDDALGGLSLAMNLGPLGSDDLYEAMDYLLAQQEGIERRLAAKHLQGGTLVLYDVSSSYYYGHHCPLAKHGYSRDHRSDLPQIVYGLLCSPEGVPVAVEVFEGNTADPVTLSHVVTTLRDRFKVEHVVLVGDRGMITQARIREDLQPAGMEYITALRAESIRMLVEQDEISPTLFDQKNLCEISSPAFPGERLVACYNPALAEERRRKREVLLTSTEKALQKIADAVKRARRPLRGVQAISLRVGKVAGQYKMAKHFLTQITETSFAFSRNEASIAHEQKLDGLYVIRTPVSAESFSAEQAVGAYKSLARVERAFRCAKSVDLQVRPIHHRLASRVRSHVFLCMLAYYVQWHMREALAPLLFEDDDKEAGRAMRESEVAPARRSPAADAKAAKKRNANGDRVQSFRTLLRSLSTLTVNRIVPTDQRVPPFYKLSTPTPLQQRAFELLKVQPKL